MNRINTSFYSFAQVIIFNEGKSRSLRWNRRSSLRIITNCSISVTPVRVFTHEFTCRNFDQSETRLVLERDQAKSNFSNSICPSFLLLVKETKFKIFIGFFSHRELSIFYSNGGSTVRACWGSAKNYLVSLSEVFYDTKSIRLYFWSRFKQL